MPQTAYGQAHTQTLGQHHQPSHSFSHPLGSQANARLAVDGQQYSSQRAPSNQAYGSSDLASQMLLQRLQQQSYNQASQRGAGLDRFFNPMAFNTSQAGHAPSLPVSICLIWQYLVIDPIAFCCRIAAERGICKSKWPSECVMVLS